MNSGTFRSLTGFPLALAAALLTSGSMGLGACKTSESSPAGPEARLWDEDSEGGDTAVERLAARNGSTASLRVMWWNIQRGELAAEITRRARAGSHLPESYFNPLFLNMDWITRAPLKPDVLVLGEFHDNGVSTDVKNLLEKRYKHRFFSRYSEDLGDERLGIAVYSRYPIEEFRRAGLDWTPLRASAAERERYRRQWIRKSGSTPRAFRTYRRTYLNLIIRKPGRRPVHLVPVHLVQPWNHMRRFKSAVRTAWNLVFSEDNPLMYQLRRLRGHLEWDFGPYLTEADVLTLGDFNIPKTLLLETEGYERISNGLTEAFTGQPLTFPAASSPLRREQPYRSQPLKLDHAFASSSLEFTESAVLPLQGSDHYPIYVIVR